MIPSASVATFAAGLLTGQFARRPGAATAPAGFLRRWLGEPRGIVLLVLGLVIVVGGGMRLLRSWRARAAVRAIESDDPAPESILAAAEHGRAGLMELFRLLSEGRSEPVREAAGLALSKLWVRDELIAEEEKAIVRRSFRVDWLARRRYPRAIRAEIPIEIHFGLPFLNEDREGIRPSNLEWSYRVNGAHRASLEQFSAWTHGPGKARFTLIPADFETSVKVPSPLFR